MRVVADLAERYSFDELRVTHVQNLVLPHVRKDDLFALWEALVAAGLATANAGLSPTSSPARASIIARSPTRARSRSPRRSRGASPIRSAQREIGELGIKISGCINACGHHHVGHIGILGLEKNGAEILPDHARRRPRPRTPRSASGSGPGLRPRRCRMRSSRSSTSISKSARPARNSSRHIGGSASRPSGKLSNQPWKERSVALLDEFGLKTDGFTRVAEGASLPQGDVILPLGRLLAEGREVLARGDLLGAQLPNTAKLDEVWPLLDDVAARLDRVSLLRGWARLQPCQGPSPAGLSRHLARLRPLDRRSDASCARVRLRRGRDARSGDRASADRAMGRRAPSDHASLSARRRQGLEHSGSASRVNGGFP